MKTVMKIVHYLPRVLAFGFAAFTIPFIGEGFDPEYGWQSGVGHGVLSALLIGLAFLAHKKPWVGGSIFIGFGFFILGIAIVNAPAVAGVAWWLTLLTRVNPVGLIVSGIGVLFFIDAKFNKPD